MSEPVERHSKSDAAVSNERATILDKKQLSVDSMDVLYTEIISPIGVSQKNNWNITRQKLTPPMDDKYYAKKVTIHNLPWWTSDMDIQNAIEQLEISDLVQITFKENRLNGVSKGIATIEITTEKGYNQLLEKLPTVYESDTRGVIIIVALFKTAFSEFYGRRVVIDVEKPAPTTRKLLPPAVDSQMQESSETVNAITAPISIKEIEENSAKPTSCVPGLANFSTTNPLADFVNRPLSPKPGKVLENRRHSHRTSDDSRSKRKKRTYYSPTPSRSSKKQRPDPHRRF